VILEAPDFAWLEADLTGLEESAQRDKIRKLVGNREAGFDLERGPALHVVLATLAPRKHVLLLRLPALCADLRALSSLVHEIGLTYADGFNPTDEVMQYADVAEWQQELLASDETKTGRDYWRDYCRKIDFSALASVLSAFEETSVSEFFPDVVVKQIDVGQLGALLHGSLQDFLLACWQVYLSRLTGRSSVTVGCQLDGRNYPELANTLGLLSKYLPLESTYSDATTFKSLLEKVQHDVADFRNWQDSFSWNSAGLPSGFEQGPMLPLAFDFAEFSGSKDYGELRFTTLRQEANGGRFRLKLSARRRDDRV
jgi:hypothetical protein